MWEKRVLGPVFDLLACGQSRFEVTDKNIFAILLRQGLLIYVLILDQNIFGRSFVTGGGKSADLPFI